MLKWAAAFLGGAATAVLLAALLDQGESVPIRYGVLSAHTVVVEVIHAPGVRCGLAGVEESPQDIRILARCYPPLFFSGSLAAVPRWYVVKLHEPLAGRSVMDGSGTPAEECSDQLCGAASG